MKTFSIKPDIKDYINFYLGKACACRGASYVHSYGSSNFKLMRSAMRENAMLAKDLYKFYIRYNK
jgi:hypothetical protein